MQDDVGQRFFHELILGMRIFCIWGTHLRRFMTGDEHPKAFTGLMNSTFSMVCLATLETLGRYRSNQRVPEEHLRIMWETRLYIADRGN